MEQRTGTLATLSMIAALGGFVLIFAGNPIIGFALALFAIIFGIFGLLRAASPKVSGGILSIVAIILGVIGAFVAVLGVMGMIIF